MGYSLLAKELDSSMPHPNPPAKQNLDKKGLLTISNSAYCNIHLVYGYILTALNSPIVTNKSLKLPPLNLKERGEGRGEGLLYV